MKLQDDLIFFKGGERVQVKHDLPNKPIMLVKNIVKAKPQESKPILLGVRCFWFDKNETYQEQTFSSKDLEKL